MDGKMIFNLNDKNCELPTRESNPEAWKILVEHVGLHASYEEIFNGETTMTVNQVLEELICERDLPTEGGAWDAMLEHVGQHASYDEIFADGKPEIHDLFDDDDIVGYIQEAGIPIDEIYDDDEILESNCVKTFSASLLEKVKTKTEEWEATAGGLYKQRIAELEETMESIIRETLARHGRCDDGVGGVFELCDTDEE